MSKQLKIDFQIFDPEANGLVPFVDEVERFNDTFNKPNNYEPTIPAKKEWQFVYDFILEELEEYKEACERGDIVSKACKTEEEAIQTVSQRSKEQGEACHFEKVAKGRYIVYRSRDKKVMKSINYFRPNLHQFFSTSELAKFQ